MKHTPSDNMVILWCCQLQRLHCKPATRGHTLAAGHSELRIGDHAGKARAELHAQAHRTRTHACMLRRPARHCRSAAAALIGAGEETIGLDDWSVVPVSP